MADSSTKKILIISSEFPPNVGGIGKHAYHIAKYLSKENFDVAVVADIINVDKEQLHTFQKDNSFKFYPVKRSAFTPFTYAERIVKALYHAKNANVIICSGKFSIWTANALKKFYKNKKFVAIVHGTELLLPQKRDRLLTKSALQKFDSIIAVSQFTKNLLPESIKDKQNILVIPNGIDIKEFEPHLQEKKIEPEENIELITVGSQSERKGQINVINAMPELLKYFSKIHYHIVGKPVIQQQLNDAAKRLSVEKNITFHGVASTTELINLLKHTHVKLMLSNNTSYGDVEGFGIAVLEANALGLPAIGSLNTGLEDAIDNYKTGILVDAKNTEAIVQALEEIISDYGFYSANAIKWAKKHDWSLLIKNYIKVLDQL